MTPEELDAWAIRHHVSAEAMDELRRGFRPLAPVVEGVPGAEAHAQSLVRIEAAQRGIYLWRNNNGALKDERGVPVRFGLANDNPAINAVFKSSDLIGIRPVAITPAMVGLVIGQFVAREIKRLGWTYAGTPRERAQAAFIHAVQAKGGDASFATGPGSL